MGGKGVGGGDGRGVERGRKECEMGGSGGVVKGGMGKEGEEGEGVRGGRGGGG